MTDREVIEACLEGDRKAFELLYKTHSPTLYGMSVRYARNRSDADDILQEGFAKIFKNLNQFKFNGSFEGWMKRIVVNTALNYYKKKSNVIYVENLFDESFVNISSFDQVSDLNHQDLLTMIGNLPDGSRTIFNLYAIEGYSHKEIAEQLDITEGTSKSQLSYARRLLKGTIEKNMQVEPKKKTG